MGEKWNAAFTVILLSAVILIFTAADFAREDRTFSERSEERRVGKEC